MSRVWKALALTAAVALAGAGCQNKMYSENQDLARQNRELQQRLDDSSHQPVVQAQAAGPVAPPLIQPPAPPARAVETNTPAQPMPSNGKAQPDLGNLEVTRDAAAGTTTVNLPSDVFFAPGQATLQPDAKKSLSKVIAALKKEYRSKPVRIDGHTDSDPIVKSHWKSNQELSEKRADAVKDYLVSKGIDADRITTMGFGDTKPKSKSNKKANRRVELVVLQTK